MCGRYAVYGPKSRSAAEKKDLADADRALVLRFLARYLEQAAPRYNIAPQQGKPANYVPIIRRKADGELELAMAQWWLLPSWSKAPRIKYMTFNARIETVGNLASFREPFRKRRCLIPASGWYEWQELPTGNLPWYIHPARDDVVFFAGLWDRWESGGQVIESCSIIIGPANETIRAFHDRMPYTVADEDIHAWLDPDFQDAGEIAKLLKPIPPGAIAAHRVSRRVNAAKFDDAALIEPLAEEPAPKE
jgi:putative SOS response-associated peptidase YedK